MSFIPVYKINVYILTLVSKPLSNICKFNIFFVDNTIDFSFCFIGLYE